MISKRNIAIKIIAALLIVGGFAGIIAIVLTWSEISATGAIARFLAVIFGFSIWAGVSLWKGHPQALRWSKILLALQIPIINSSGLFYQFYTAVSLGVMFEYQPDVKLNLDFRLGSSANFLVSAYAEHFSAGINLAALAAFIYLTNVSKSSGEKSG